MTPDNSPSYVTSGIVELRRMVRELNGMSDNDVEVLYSTWSEIGSCASWLVVDEATAKAFESWLYASQDGGFTKRENTRLRALLKSIEFRGSADRCPFYDCNIWPGERHHPECPGFDQSGNVK